MQPLQQFKKMGVKIGQQGQKLIQKFLDFIISAVWIQLQLVTFLNC